MLNEQIVRKDSLCLHCSKDYCKFLLTGEEYYGQETSKGKNGIITHDCPKFIKEEGTDSIDTGRIITWDEYLRNQNVENLAFEIKTFMHIIDALNSLNIDCKYNSNVYKFYSKIE